jgi:Ca-activated chloride channel family protein
MFRLASPYFLVLLLLIPALIYYRRRYHPRACLKLPTVKFTTAMTLSPALRLKWVLPVLKYTALGLIIIALARPQWGTRQMNVLTAGINIVLALDLSESMAALDFKKDGMTINRLEAVKDVVTSFVAHRSGDRIGMVVFGDHAYTQIPLTRDYTTIVSILERLQIGAAGKSTAIGDAIGISLKRLEDIQSKSNIIILLTDGRSNAGELSPQTATEIAAQKNVKIYTIGVGSRGKVPFLVQHPIYGERTVYQRVDIDEKALQRIAQQTEGQYFRAEDLESLESIYTTIDSLEKTKVKIKRFAEYREYYPYLLMPAFFCLGLWILLSNTRYLSIP